MICILCLYSTGEAGSLSRRIIRAGILVASKVTSLFTQRGNTALEVPFKITYSFPVLVDRTNRDRQEVNWSQPGLGILVSNENFHAPEGSSRYGIQQKLDLHRNQPTQRKVGEKHDHSINNFPSCISNGCEQISPTDQARQNTSAQVRGDAVGCEGDNTSVSEVHNHTVRSDETGLQETENTDVAKVNASTRQNEEDIEMEEISQDEETDDDDDDDATIKLQVQEHVPVHIKIDDDRGQEDEHVKKLHESMKIDQATVRQLKVKVETATKQDCKSSEKGKTALETQEVMVKSIVVSEVMTDSPEQLPKPQPILSSGLVSVTSCTKNISECLPGPGPLQSESEAPQVANPCCSQCASGESHDLLHKDNSPTANSKQSPKSTRIDKDLTSTKPRQDKSETALDEKTSGHESQLDAQTEDDSGFFSSQLASMTPPATYLDKDTREHVTPSDADENEVSMQVEMQHLDAKRAEIPIHNARDLKTCSEDRSNHTARPSPHDEDCEAIYIPNSTFDNFSQTKPDDLINPGSKVVVNDCMCQPGEQQNNTSTKQSTVFTVDGMSTRHPHGATPNSDSEQTHNNPGQGGLLVARSGPQNSDHPQQLCKVIAETETVTTRNIYQVLDMGADRHKDSKGNLCFSYTTTLTTTAEYPNQIITSKDSLFETMAEKHMLHAPFINQSNDAGNSSEQQSGRDDCQNGTRILSTTGDVSFAGEAKTTTDGMVVLYNEMPISDSGSNKSVRTFVSSKLFPQLKQVKLQCTTKEGQLAGHSAAQGRRSIFTECEQHWLSGNNPEEDPTGQRPPTGVVCSEESEDQLDSEWQDRVPAEGETDYANEPTTSKSPNTMLSQELPAGAAAFATATTSTEEECGNVNEASNMLPEILSTDSLTTMTDVPNKSSETNGVTTNDTNVDGGISHEVLKESQEIGLTVETSVESSPPDNTPTTGASLDTSANMFPGVQTLRSVADGDEHLGDGALDGNTLDDTTHNVPSESTADVSLTGDNKQINIIHEKSSKKELSKLSPNTPAHFDDAQREQSEGEMNDDDNSIAMVPNMTAETDDLYLGDVGTDNPTRFTEDTPSDGVLYDEGKLPNGADKTPNMDTESGGEDKNKSHEGEGRQQGMNKSLGESRNVDESMKEAGTESKIKEKLSGCENKDKKNPNGEEKQMEKKHDKCETDKNMSTERVRGKTYKTRLRQDKTTDEDKPHRHANGNTLKEAGEHGSADDMKQCGEGGRKLMKNLKGPESEHEKNQTGQGKKMNKKYECEIDDEKELHREKRSISQREHEKIKIADENEQNEESKGKTQRKPGSVDEMKPHGRGGRKKESLGDFESKSMENRNEGERNMGKIKEGESDDEIEPHGAASREKQSTDEMKLQGKGGKMKTKKLEGFESEDEKSFNASGKKIGKKIIIECESENENEPHERANREKQRKPGGHGSADEMKLHGNGGKMKRNKVGDFEIEDQKNPNGGRKEMGKKITECGSEYVNAPHGAGGRKNKKFGGHESEDKKKLTGRGRNVEKKNEEFKQDDEIKLQRELKRKTTEDENKPFGGARKKIKPITKKRNDSKSQRNASKPFQGVQCQPRQNTKHYTNDTEWDKINHSIPELQKQFSDKRRHVTEEGSPVSPDNRSIPIYAPNRSDVLSPRYECLHKA